MGAQRRRRESRFRRRTDAADQKTALNAVSTTTSGKFTPSSISPRFQGFEAGTVVDKELLLENGLIKYVKDDAGLKVLGNGEINVALTVKAAKFSASAKEAIEKAGGKAEVE